MSDASDETYFLLKRLFPEPLKTLRHKLVSIESVKDESLIVLDANALLLPFRLEQQNYEKIESLYKTLIGQKRLVVPGQALREFLKNRGQKLAELYKVIADKKDAVGKLTMSITKQSPLLQNVEEFKNFLASELELSKILEDAKAKHVKVTEKLVKKLESLSYDDPVSQSYQNLFQEDTVFDPEFETATLLRDLDFRNTHEIPPGYKDRNKDSNREGDFLIWHTILELGRLHKRSVIFVSSDEKADWFQRSDNKSLFPRFELLEEFRHTSEGKQFHIISLTQLLKLNKVTTKVIEEVAKEEASLARSKMLGMYGDAEVERNRYLKTWEAHAERCLLNHLDKKHPNHQLLPNGVEEFPQFLLQQESETGLVHQVAVGFWATPAGTGYDIPNFGSWLQSADAFIRNAPIHLNRRAEFYSLHHGGPGTYEGHSFISENYQIPSRFIKVIFGVCYESGPDSPEVRENKVLEGSS